MTTVLDGAFTNLVKMTPLFQPPPCWRIYHDSTPQQLWWLDWWSVIFFMIFYELLYCMDDILIVTILQLWWSNCKIHVLIRWYAILSRNSARSSLDISFCSGGCWRSWGLVGKGGRCPAKCRISGWVWPLFFATVIPQQRFLKLAVGLSERYPLIQWIIMIVLQKSSSGFPVSDAAIINLRDFLKLGVFRLVLQVLNFTRNRQEKKDLKKAM